MKTVYIQCDDIDVTVESEYLEEAYESVFFLIFECFFPQYLLLLLHVPLR